MGIHVLLLSPRHQILQRATDNRLISRPGGSSQSCPHGEEAQGVEDPLIYRQDPLIFTMFIASPNLIYKAESAILGSS